ncbi:MAG: VanZ family protein [Bacteroidales bacterium]
MKRYLLVIISYLFVTYFSLAPSVSGGALSDIPNIDKIVHFCFYFGISFLSYISIHRKSYPAYRIYLMVLLVPIIFGGVIELLQQYYFPPRSAEWADFAADILGSLFGYWFGKLLVFRCKKLFGKNKRVSDR